MRETIGFIGAGNMGKAMIEGICQNHVFNTVWVCDHHQENLDVLHEKYGVETSLDEKKVAKNSDVLVLSVKPKHYPKVIEKNQGQCQIRCDYCGYCGRCNHFRCEDILWQRYKGD